MIDPQSVLNQVRQGQIPPNWEVFYGSRPSPLALGCFVAVIAALILSVCSFLVTFATLVVRASLRIQAFNLFASLTSLGPIIGSVIVAIALAVGILRWWLSRKDTRDPDPLIVVMPDGFIEYHFSRKPIKLVSFADLADAFLDLEGRISRVGSLRRLRFALYLSYKDGGKEERWSPMALFGNEQEIIISITMAYQEYTRPSQPLSRNKKIRRRNRGNKRK